MKDVHWQLEDKEVPKTNMMSQDQMWMRKGLGIQALDEAMTLWHFRLWDVPKIMLWGVRQGASLCLCIYLSKYIYILSYIVVGPISLYLWPDGPGNLKMEIVFREAVEMVWVMGWQYWCWDRTHWINTARGPGQHPAINQLSYWKVICPHHFVIFENQPPQDNVSRCWSRFKPRDWLRSISGQCHS